jgi:transcriptional pleiotropic regulator of transition state genes
MKSTGMVRDIDEMGRIVIPKELRKAFNLNVKDPVEIFTDDDSIILKKYNPGCTFCGAVNGLTMYKHKLVCDDCIEELGKMN